MTTGEPRISGHAPERGAAAHAAHAGAAAAARRGWQHGWPLALAYAPVAVTFGALAAAGGWPAPAALGLSALVYAGASQFLALQLAGAAASPATVVMATFFLNLRHFLMSAGLAPRWEPGLSRWAGAALSFGITDESFSVAVARGGLPLRAAYAGALFATAYGGWVAGTAAGYALGSLIPPAVSTAFTVGLYALFLALLWPMVRASRAALAAAAAAAGLNALLAPRLGPGWGVVASMALAAAAGAAFAPAPPGPGGAPDLPRPDGEPAAREGGGEGAPR
ncbi:MAG: AzlC family ABC transporter permease [Firmicutes bacterium]|nr:AzlC family ABC transporter permease [Bacillota bacterium]